MRRYQRAIGAKFAKLFFAQFSMKAAIPRSRSKPEFIEQLCIDYQS
jgi:hypothetical protein